MGKLSESLCFCNGMGKSEKMKAAIFSNRTSFGRIQGEDSKCGFLIHRNLFLTSHANVPSIAAAESCVVIFPDGSPAALFPHRFFITSSVLDLTIVGSDSLPDDQSPQPHWHLLKTTHKPHLDLGTAVYFLGYSAANEVTIGEGKVVIATDNLVKLSNDGVSWSPGSAGFDHQGNLAFMICDPMRIATSPNGNTKSSSTSSSSTEPLMQFGIPVSVICDWLNQHWVGSLDGTVKPKLPLMRLMSNNAKNEASSASFAVKQVFKSPDDEKDENPPQASHLPRTQIYESSKVTAGPLRRPEANPSFHLLNINFPPKITPKTHYSTSNCAVEDHEASSTASVNDVGIEFAKIRTRNGYSSDEETMYSAETAESRNYVVPKTEPIGRSQSCVIHNRLSGRNLGGQRSVIDQQRSVVNSSKGYSHGATSQRSNDYFSPTVSSRMKKRNSLELHVKPRQTVVHSSPRWMF